VKKDIEYYQEQDLLILRYHVGSGRIPGKSTQSLVARVQVVASHP
jgi:hypothetical protein